MKHTLSRILFAAAALIAASVAQAQTANVVINANVKKVCTATGPAAPLLINQYDFSVGGSASGDVTLVCSKGTTYKFAVDNGGHFTTVRRLHATLPATYAVPDDYMSYTVAARTDAAGTGFSPGVFTDVGTGNTVNTGDRSTGLTSSLTLGIQATIPAGQDGAVDATTDYTDTVVVTISY